jgi:Ca-activated chloride channel homolog
MFDFEFPIHFGAIIILPLLVGIIFWALREREKLVARFGLPTSIAKLMPHFSVKKTWISNIFLLVGLFFLIISWANPRLGTTNEITKSRSLDIMIALDISESMNAQDLTPNRLVRAKIFTEKLLDKLQGNRVGLIVFAGNAYLLMPLTNDFAAATMFLRAANSGMASNQGTAIAEAISLVNQSFERDGQGGRALILLTDGENHDEEALKMAENAAENGLQIFPIGVGTPEGAQIPIDNGGGLPDVKRDEMGQPIVTKMNQNLLNELAEAGNGTAFDLRMGNENLVPAIKNQLDQLEKTDRQSSQNQDFKSWFQWFLAIGFLFILGDWIFKMRQNAAPFLLKK